MDAREVAVGGLPSARLAALARAVAPLAGETARWVEVVSDDAGRVLGLVTAGEGPDFTARTDRVLATLGFPPRARADHQDLARRFDHRRALFKVEAQPDGRVRAARYHRRRPPLPEALAALGEGRVHPDVLEKLREAARLLGKRTVHFAAVAHDTEGWTERRIYLSQFHGGPGEDGWDRLAAVARLVGVPAPPRAAHRATLGPPGRSWFVSLRFQEDRLIPVLKVDYEALDPAVLRGWLPGDRLAGAEARARALLAAAGSARLSHLGIRCRADGSRQAKFYARVRQAPDRRAPP